jgi:hypothetical protein
VSAPAWAGVVTITVGDHIVAANDSSEPIPIMVSGTDYAQGMNLYAQIGEPGPQADPRDRPVFKEPLDPVPDGYRPFRPEMLAGSVWDPGNDGGTRLPMPPEYGGDQFFWGEVTMTGAVPDPPGAALMNGTLVTFLIDTVGVPLGVYDLSLTNTYEGPTELLYLSEGKDVTVDIIDGTITVALAGDATLDGYVDFSDFVRLFNNWTGTLPPGTGGKVWGQGDFTHDGAVDFSDFTKLFNNWTGSGPKGQTGAVPEPASAALLLGLLAVVPFVLWRRKRTK